MRHPIAAAVLLCAVSARAATLPDEKAAAAASVEAPPHDPSKPVEGPRSPRPGFEPPAQTIPETVKTPNEGTSKPPVKSDAEIGREIEKALLDDPQAPRVRNLAIAISDGKVLIRGRVSTQADKDRVTAKAGAAAGLRNVANELEVAAP